MVPKRVRGIWRPGLLSPPVCFRDDNESYNHYQNGNWENIVGVVRQDVATYAY